MCASGASGPRRLRSGHRASIPPRTALPQQFEQMASDAQVPVMDRWWEAFDDPQLTNLILEGLAENRDARSAYFRIREARAIRDQSLSVRNPTGSVAGSVKTQAGEQLSGTDLFGSASRGWTIRVYFRRKRSTSAGWQHARPTRRSGCHGRSLMTCWCGNRD